MTAKKKVEGQVPPTVPEPGDRDFDWAAVYTEYDEVFTYTDAEGRTVAVPRLEDITLPFQVQLKARKDPVELCWARLEKVLTAQGYAVLDTWTDEQILEFFKAWLVDANLTLGESKRSSTS